MGVRKGSLNYDFSSLFCFNWPVLLGVIFQDDRYIKILFLEALITILLSCTVCNVWKSFCFFVFSLCNVFVDPCSVSFFFYFAYSTGGTWYGCINYLVIDARTGFFFITSFECFLFATVDGESKG